MQTIPHGKQAGADAGIQPGYDAVGKRALLEIGEDADFAVEMYGPPQQPPGPNDGIRCGSRARGRFEVLDRPDGRADVGEAFGRSRLVSRANHEDLVTARELVEEGRGHVLRLPEILASRVAKGHGRRIVYDY